MTRVRTQDLTLVCEFNFSGLPLHLRQKNKIKKEMLTYALRTHVKVSKMKIIPWKLRKFNTQKIEI